MTFSVSTREQPPTSIVVAELVEVSMDLSVIQQNLINKEAGKKGSTHLSLSEWVEKQKHDNGDKAADKG